MPKEKPTKDPETCQHPPNRYYVGYAYNPFTGNANREPKNMWIACCDCGAALRVPEWAQVIEEFESLEVEVSNVP